MRLIHSQLYFIESIPGVHSLKIVDTIFLCALKRLTRLETTGNFLTKIDGVGKRHQLYANILKSFILKVRKVGESIVLNEKTEGLLQNSK